MKTHCLTALTHCLILETGATLKLELYAKVNLNAPIATYFQKIPVQVYFIISGAQRVVDDLNKLKLVNGRAY